MDLELLKTIVKGIREEEFDMANWVRDPAIEAEMITAKRENRNGSAYTEVRNRWMNQRFQVSNLDCGTTACLAGHIALHEGHTLTRTGLCTGAQDEHGQERHVSEVALEALGCNTEESEKLYKIFYDTGIANLNKLKGRLSVAFDTTFE